MAVTTCSLGGQSHLVSTGTVCLPTERAIACIIGSVAQVKLEAPVVGYAIPLLYLMPERKV